MATINTNSNLFKKKFHPFSKRSINLLFLLIVSINVPSFLMVSACIPPLLSNVSFSQKIDDPSVSENRFRTFDTMCVQFESPFSGNALAEIVNLNNSDYIMWSNLWTISSGIQNFEVVLDPYRSLNRVNKFIDFIPGNYSLKITLWYQSTWLLPSTLLAYSEDMPFEVIKAKSQFQLDDHSFKSINRAINSTDLGFSQLFSANLINPRTELPISDEIQLYLENFGEYSLIDSSFTDLLGYYRYSKNVSSPRIGQLCKFEYLGNELFSSSYFIEDLDAGDIFDEFNYTIPDQLRFNRPNGTIEEPYERFDRIEQTSSSYIKKFDWRNLESEQYYGFTISNPSDQYISRADSDLDCFYVLTHSDRSITSPLRIFSSILQYPGYKGKANITVQWRTFQDTFNSTPDFVNSPTYNISLILTDTDKNILQKIPFFLGNEISWNIINLEINSSLLEYPALFRLGFEIKINPGSTSNIFDNPDAWIFAWDYIKFNSTYNDVFTNDAVLSQWDGFKFDSTTKAMNGNQYLLGSNIILNNRNGSDSTITSNYYNAIYSPISSNNPNTGIENYFFNTNPFAQTSSNTWGLNNIDDGFDWAFGDRSYINNNNDYFSNYSTNAISGTSNEYRTYYQDQIYSPIFRNTPSVYLTKAKRWAGMGMEISFPTLSPSILKNVTYKMTIGTNEYFHLWNSYRIKVLSITDTTTELWNSDWKTSDSGKYTVSFSTTNVALTSYLAIILETGNSWSSGTEIRLLWDELEITSTYNIPQNLINFESQSSPYLRSNNGTVFVSGEYQIPISFNFADPNEINNNIQLNFNCFDNLWSISKYDGNVPFSISIIGNCPDGTKMPEILLLSDSLSTIQNRPIFTSLNTWFGYSIQNISLICNFQVPNKAIGYGIDPADKYLIFISNFNLIRNGIVIENELNNLNNLKFYSKTISSSINKEAVSSTITGLNFKSFDAETASNAKSKTRILSNVLESFNFAKTLFSGLIRLEFENQISTKYSINDILSSQQNMSIWFDLYVEDEISNLYIGHSAMIWNQKITALTNTQTYSVIYNITSLFIGTNIQNYVGDFQLAIRVEITSLVPGKTPGISLMLSKFNLIFEDLPPNAEWITPNDNSLLAGTQTFTIQTSDDSIEYIKFQLLHAENNFQPMNLWKPIAVQYVMQSIGNRFYSWIFNSKSVPDGQYALLAQVMDPTKKIGTTSYRLIEIDNTAPTIWFNNLNNYDILASLIPVQFNSTATDIKQIELYIQSETESSLAPIYVGADINGNDGWSIDINPNFYVEDQYTITANAYDYVDNKYTTFVSSVLFNLITPIIEAPINKSSFLQNTINFKFSSGSNVIDFVKIYYSKTAVPSFSAPLPTDWIQYLKLDRNLQEDLYEFSFDTLANIPVETPGFYYWRIDFHQQYYRESVYIIGFVYNQHPITQISPDFTIETNNQQLIANYPNKLQFTIDADFPQSIKNIQYFYELQGIYAEPFIDNITAQEFLRESREFLIESQAEIIGLNNILRILQNPTGYTSKSQFDDLLRDSKLVAYLNSLPSSVWRNDDLNYLREIESRIVTLLSLIPSTPIIGATEYTTDDLNTAYLYLIHNIKPQLTGSYTDENENVISNSPLTRYNLASYDSKINWNPIFSNRIPDSYIRFGVIAEDYYNQIESSYTEWFWLNNHVPTLSSFVPMNSSNIQINFDENPESFRLNLSYYIRDLDISEITGEVGLKYKLTDSEFIQIGDLAGNTFSKPSFNLHTAIIQGIFDQDLIEFLHTNINYQPYIELKLTIKDKFGAEKSTNFTYNFIEFFDNTAPNYNDLVISSEKVDGFSVSLTAFDPNFESNTQNGIYMMEFWLDAITMNIYESSQYIEALTHGESEFLQNEISQAKQLIGLFNFDNINHIWKILPQNWISFNAIPEGNHQFFIRITDFQGNYNITSFAYTLQKSKLNIAANEIIHTSGENKEIILSLVSNSEITSQISQVKFVLQGITSDNNLYLQEITDADGTDGFNAIFDNVLEGQYFVNFTYTTNQGVEISNFYKTLMIQNQIQFTQYIQYVITISDQVPVDIVINLENGQIITGVYPIQTDVSNGKDYETIIFYIDEKQYSVYSEGKSGTYYLNSIELTTGYHSIIAQVFYSNGYRGNSSKIFFIVDNSPPQFNLTNGGVRINGVDQFHNPIFSNNLFNIFIDVLEDYSEITSVDLVLTWNNVILFSDIIGDSPTEEIAFPISYQLDFTQLGLQGELHQGKYILTVSAKSQSGVVFSKPIELIYDPIAPTINFYQLQSIIKTESLIIDLNVNYDSNMLIDSPIQSISLYWETAFGTNYIGQAFYNSTQSEFIHNYRFIMRRPTVLVGTLKAISIDSSGNIAIIEQALEFENSPEITFNTWPGTYFDRNQDGQITTTGSLQNYASDYNVNTYYYDTRTTNWISLSTNTEINDAYFSLTWIPTEEMMTSERAFYPISFADTCVVSPISKNNFATIGHFTDLTNDQLCFLSNNVFMIFTEIDMYTWQRDDIEFQILDIQEILIADFDNDDYSEIMIRTASQTILLNCQYDSENEAFIWISTNYNLPSTQSISHMAIINGHDIITSEYSPSTSIYQIIQYEFDIIMGFTVLTSWNLPQNEKFLDLSVSGSNFYVLSNLSIYTLQDQSLNAIYTTTKQFSGLLYSKDQMILFPVYTGSTQNLMFGRYFSNIQQWEFFQTRQYDHYTIIRSLGIDLISPDSQILYVSTASGAETIGVTNAPETGLRTIEHIEPTNYKKELTGSVRKEQFIATGNPIEDYYSGHVNYSNIPTVNDYNNIEEHEINANSPYIKKDPGSYSISSGVFNTNSLATKQTILGTNTFGRWLSPFPAETITNLNTIENNNANKPILSNFGFSETYSSNNKNWNHQDKGMWEINTPLATESKPNSATWYGTDDYTYDTSILTFDSHNIDQGTADPNTVFSRINSKDSSSYRLTTDWDESLIIQFWNGVTTGYSSDGTYLYYMEPCVGIELKITIENNQQCDIRLEIEYWKITSQNPDGTYNMVLQPIYNYDLPSSNIHDNTITTNLFTGTTNPIIIRRITFKHDPWAMNSYRTFNIDYFAMKKPNWMGHVGFYSTTSGYNSYFIKEFNGQFEPMGNNFKKVQNKFQDTITQISTSAEFKISDIMNSNMAGTKLEKYDSFYVTLRPYIKNYITQNSVSKTFDTNFQSSTKYFDYCSAYVSTGTSTNPYKIKISSNGYTLLNVDNLNNQFDFPSNSYSESIIKDKYSSFSGNTFELSLGFSIKDILNRIGGGTIDTIKIEVIFSIQWNFDTYTNFRNSALSTSSLTTNTEYQMSAVMTAKRLNDLYPEITQIWDQYKDVSHSLVYEFNNLQIGPSTSYLEFDTKLEPSFILSDLRNNDINTKITNPMLGTNPKIFMEQNFGIIFKASIKTWKNYLGNIYSTENQIYISLDNSQYYPEIEINGNNLFVEKLISSKIDLPQINPNENIIKIQIIIDCVYRFKNPSLFGDILQKDNLNQFSQTFDIYRTNILINNVDFKSVDIIPQEIITQKKGNVLIDLNYEPECLKLPTTNLVKITLSEDKWIQFNPTIDQLNWAQSFDYCNFTLNMKFSIQSGTQALSILNFKNLVLSLQNIKLINPFNSNSGFNFNDLASIYAITSLKSSTFYEEISNKFNLMLDTSTNQQIFDLNVTFTYIGTENDELLQQFAFYVLTGQISLQFDYQFIGFWNGSNVLNLNDINLGIISDSVSLSGEVYFRSNPEESYWDSLQKRMIQNDPNFFIAKNFVFTIPKESFKKYLGAMITIDGNVKLENWTFTNNEISGYTNLFDLNNLDDNEKISRMNQWISFNQPASNYNGLTPIAIEMGNNNFYGISTSIAASVQKSLEYGLDAMGLSYCLFNDGRAFFVQQGDNFVLNLIIIMDYQNYIGSNNSLLYLNVNSLKMDLILDNSQSNLVECLYPLNFQLMIPKSQKYNSITLSLSGSVDISFNQINEELYDLNTISYDKRPDIQETQVYLNLNYLDFELTKKISAGTISPIQIINGNYQFSFNIAKIFSDPAELQSYLKDQGDYWELNGNVLVKFFIQNQAFGELTMIASASLPESQRYAKYQSYEMPLMNITHADLGSIEINDWNNDNQMDILSSNGLVLYKGAGKGVFEVKCDVLPLDGSENPLATGYSLIRMQSNIPTAHFINVPIEIMPDTNNQIPIEILEYTPNLDSLTLYHFDASFNDWVILSEIQNTQQQTQFKYMINTINYNEGANFFKLIAIKGTETREEQITVNLDKTAPTIDFSSTVSCVNILGQIEIVDGNEKIDSNLAYISRHAVATITLTEDYTITEKAVFLSKQSQNIYQIAKDNWNGKICTFSINDYPQYWDFDSIIIVAKDLSGHETLEILPMKIDDRYQLENLVILDTQDQVKTRLNDPNLSLNWLQLQYNETINGQLLDGFRAPLINTPLMIKLDNDRLTEVYTNSTGGFSYRLLNSSLYGEDLRSFGNLETDPLKIDRGYDNVIFGKRPETRINYLNPFILNIPGTILNRHIDYYKYPYFIDTTTRQSVLEYDLDLTTYAFNSTFPYVGIQFDLLIPNIQSKAGSTFSSINFTFTDSKNQEFSYSLSGYDLAKSILKASSDMVYSFELMDVALIPIIIPFTQLQNGNNQNFDHTSIIKVTIDGFDNKIHPMYDPGQEQYANQFFGCAGMYFVKNINNITAMHDGIDSLIYNFTIQTKDNKNVTDKIQIVRRELLCDEYSWIPQTVVNFEDILSFSPYTLEFEYLFNYLITEDSYGVSAATTKIDPNNYMGINFVKNTLSAVRDNTEQIIGYGVSFGKSSQFNIFGDCHDDYSQLNYVYNGDSFFKRFKLYLQENIEIQKRNVEFELLMPQNSEKQFKLELSLGNQYNFIGYLKGTGNMKYLDYGRGNWNNIYPSDYNLIQNTFQTLEGGMLYDFSSCITLQIYDNELWHNVSIISLEEGNIFGIQIDTQQNGGFFWRPGVWNARLKFFGSDHYNEFSNLGLIHILPEDVEISSPADQFVDSEAKAAYWNLKYSDHKSFSFNLVSKMTKTPISNAPVFIQLGFVPNSPQLEQMENNFANSDMDYIIHYPTNDYTKINSFIAEHITQSAYEKPVYYPFYNMENQDKDWNLWGPHIYFYNMTDASGQVMFSIDPQIIKNIIMDYGLLMLSSTYELDSMNLYLRVFYNPRITDMKEMQLLNYEETLPVRFFMDSSSSNHVYDELDVNGVVTSYINGSFNPSQYESIVTISKEDCMILTTYQEVSGSEGFTIYGQLIEADKVAGKYQAETDGTGVFIPIFDSINNEIPVKINIYDEKNNLILDRLPNENEYWIYSDQDGILSFRIDEAIVGTQIWNSLVPGTYLVKWTGLASSYYYNQPIEVTSKFVLKSPYTYSFELPSFVSPLSDRLLQDAIVQGYDSNTGVVYSSSKGNLKIDNCVPLLQGSVRVLSSQPFCENYNMTEQIKLEILANQIIVNTTWITRLPEASNWITFNVPLYSFVNTPDVDFEFRATLYNNMYGNLEWYYDWLDLTFGEDAEYPDVIVEQLEELETQQEVNYRWAGDFELQFSNLRIISSNIRENPQIWQLDQEIPSFNSEENWSPTTQICNLDSNANWKYKNGNLKSDFELSTDLIHFEGKTFTSIYNKSYLTIDFHRPESINSAWTNINAYRYYGLINGSIKFDNLISVEELPLEYNTFDKYNEEHPYNLSIGYQINQNINHSIRRVSYTNKTLGSLTQLSDALYFGMRANENWTYTIPQIILPYNARIRWEPIIPSWLDFNPGEIAKISVVVIPFNQKLAKEKIEWTLIWENNQLRITHKDSNGVNYVDNMNHPLLPEYIEGSCEAMVIINVTAIQKPIQTEFEFTQILLRPAYIEGDELTIYINSNLPPKLREKIYSSEYMYWYTFAAFSRWGNDIPDNLKYPNSGAFYAPNDLQFKITGDLAQFGNVFDYSAIPPGGIDWNDITEAELQQYFHSDSTYFEFNSEDTEGISFNRIKWDPLRFSAVQEPLIFSGFVTLDSVNSPSKTTELAKKKVNMVFMPSEMHYEIQPTVVAAGKTISTGKQTNNALNRPTLVGEKYVMDVALQYALNPSINDMVISNWTEVVSTNLRSLTVKDNLVIQEVRNQKIAADLSADNENPKITVLASNSINNKVNLEISSTNTRVMPQTLTSNMDYLILALQLTNMSKVSKMCIGIQAKENNQDKLLNMVEYSPGSFANYSEFIAQISIPDGVYTSPIIKIELEFASNDLSVNTTIGILGYGFINANSIGILNLNDNPTKNIQLIPTFWRSVSQPYTLKRQILDLGPNPYNYLNNITINAPSYQDLTLYGLTIYDANKTTNNMVHAVYDYDFNQYTRKIKERFASLMHEFIFPAWVGDSNALKEPQSEKWIEKISYDYNGDFEYELDITKIDFAGTGDFTDGFGDQIQYDFFADGIIDYQLTINKQIFEINVTNIEEYNGANGDDGNETQAYMMGIEQTSLTMEYDKNSDSIFDTSESIFTTIYSEPIPSTQWISVINNQIIKTPWSWSSKEPQFGISGMYDTDYDGTFENITNRLDIIRNSAGINNKLIPSGASISNYEPLINFETYSSTLMDWKEQYNAEGILIGYTEQQTKIDQNELITNKKIRLLGAFNQEIVGDFIIEENIPVILDPRSYIGESLGYDQHGTVYWYKSGGSYSIGFIMTSQSVNEDIPTAIGVYYDKDGDMKVEINYEDLAASSDVFIPTYWNSNSEKLAEITSIATLQQHEDAWKQFTTPENLMMVGWDYLWSAASAAASALCGTVGFGIGGVLVYMGMTALNDLFLRSVVQYFVDKVIGGLRSLSGNYELPWKEWNKPYEQITTEYRSINGSEYFSSFNGYSMSKQYIALPVTWIATKTAINDQFSMMDSKRGVENYRKQALRTVIGLSLSCKNLLNALDLTKNLFIEMMNLTMPTTEIAKDKLIEGYLHSGSYDISDEYGSSTTCNYEIIGSLPSETYYPNVNKIMKNYSALHPILCDELTDFGEVNIRYPYIESNFNQMPIETIKEYFSTLSFSDWSPSWRHQDDSAVFSDESPKLLRALGFPVDSNFDFYWCTVLGLPKSATQIESLIKQSATWEREPHTINYAHGITVTAQSSYDTFANMVIENTANFYETSQSAYKLLYSRVYWNGTEKPAIESLLHKETQLFQAITPQISQSGMMFYSPDVADLMNRSDPVIANLDAETAFAAAYYLKKYHDAEATDIRMNAIHWGIVISRILLNIFITAGIGAATKGMSLSKYMATNSEVPEILSNARQGIKVGWFIGKRIVDELVIEEAISTVAEQTFNALGVPQIWTTYEVLPGYSVTLGTEWFCEWVGEVASDASETSNMIKNAKVAIQYKRTSDKIANMKTQIESSMGTLKGHSSFSLKDLEADITNIDKVEAGKHRGGSEYFKLLRTHKQMMQKLESLQLKLTQITQNAVQDKIQAMKQTDTTNLLSGKIVMAACYDCGSGESVRLSFILAANQARAEGITTGQILVRIAQLQGLPSNKEIFVMGYKGNTVQVYTKESTQDFQAWAAQCDIIMAVDPESTSTGTTVANNIRRVMKSQFGSLFQANENGPSYGIQIGQTAAEMRMVVMRNPEAVGTDVQYEVVAEIPIANQMDSSSGNTGQPFQAALSQYLQAMQTGQQIPTMSPDIQNNLVNTWTNFLKSFTMNMLRVQSQFANIPMNLKEILSQFQQWTTNFAQTSAQQANVLQSHIYDLQQLYNEMMQHPIDNQQYQNAINQVFRDRSSGIRKDRLFGVFDIWVKQGNIINKHRIVTYSGKIAFDVQNNHVPAEFLEDEYQIISYQPETDMTNNVRDRIANLEGQAYTDPEEVYFCAERNLARFILQNSQVFSLQENSDTTILIQGYTEALPCSNCELLFEYLSKMYPNIFISQIQSSWELPEDRTNKPPGYYVWHP